MKKVLLLILTLTLSGCFTAGDFPEKRERLHEIGHEENYCEQKPERCIQGVQW